MRGLESRVSSAPRRHAPGRPLTGRRPRRSYRSSSRLSHRSRRTGGPEASSSSPSRMPQDRLRGVRIPPRGRPGQGNGYRPPMWPRAATADAASRSSAAAPPRATRPRGIRASGTCSSRSRRRAGLCPRGCTPSRPGGQGKRAGRARRTLLPRSTDVPPSIAFRTGRGTPAFPRCTPRGSLPRTRGSRLVGVDVLEAVDGRRELRDCREPAVCLVEHPLELLDPP